jgi:hypothetical protein
MSINGRSLLVAALVHAGLVGGVLAQPLPFAQRTGGVLVSDLNLDGIYLARDLTGDGTAQQPGEITLFFNATNTSGLTNPTDAVLSMTVGIDGSAYAADLTRQSIYRLRDLNNDGDALDPGEGVLFFDDTTANSTVFLATPNGLAFDSAGKLYCSSTPTTFRVGGLIAWFVDNDADGTANQAGESGVYWNMVGNNPLSSANPRPFDITWLGDTLYVLDVDPSPDAIYRARDLNSNGTIDPGEANVFIRDGDFGVTSGQGMTNDGNSILVFQRTTTQNLSGRPVFRLTDLNNSGTIDSAGEVERLWDNTNAPAGRAVSTGAAIAAGPPGTVAILSGGSSTNANVFMLRDFNGDGKFTGTSVATPSDETSAFVINDLLGIFLRTGRALTFYPGGCPQDYNRDSFVNLDDLGDFITDYYVAVAIPGGVQPSAPTYPDIAPGFGGTCPNAGDAPTPYAIDAYRTQGFRVGYSADGSNSCPLDPSQLFPNLDNLNDFITLYYSGGC